MALGATDNISLLPPKPSIQKAREDFRAELFHQNLAGLWSEVAAEHDAPHVPPVPSLVDRGLQTRSGRYLRQLSSGVRFW